MILEILAHSAREGVERLEVADLARECIIECWKRFPLYVEELDANGLVLAALRLVGKIVRPTHGTLRRLSSRELHDQLFDARNRLTAAEHQWILARFREFA